MKPMSFEIVQQVTIDKPRADVWNALVNDIDSWWAFRIGEPGATISLDATLGGAFSERWGDNEGALWGTVTYLKRGEKLRLEGALGMAGPGTNKYTFELADKGASTELTMTHYAHGVSDDEAEGRFTKGWQFLLSQCLPAWVVDGKHHKELESPLA